MAIYTIAVIPLVLLLVAETNQVDNTTKTAPYPDDLTAAGSVMRFRNWWEALCRLGPKLGYFSERSKSWLIVRKKVVQKAQSVFKDTNIKRHLGAIIRTETFKQKYVQEKIDQWIKELRVLCKIARYET